MSMSYICNLTTESQYTPILNRSEEYKADNVTVTVEWAQQVGVMYDVQVSPLAPIRNRNRRYHLMVSYNMEYNLSVVAVASCGNATASITLDYGELSILVVQSSMPT